MEKPGRFVVEFTNGTRVNVVPFLFHFHDWLVGSIYPTIDEIHDAAMLLQVTEHSTQKEWNECEMNRINDWGRGF